MCSWIQALPKAPLWRPSHENMATLKAILHAKLQAYPILPKSVELDITGSPKKHACVWTIGHVFVVVRKLVMRKEKRPGNPVHRTITAIALA